MKKNTILIMILIIAVAYVCYVFFSKIPLYEKWVDITSFENQFNTNLVIYSNVWLNKNKSYIQKDKKTYEIPIWFSDYDFFVDKSWSQILFKSDNLYQNTFAFLVFKWWEFVQIYPQSAINIDRDYNIEILNWEIKYFPSNSSKFHFTWSKNWTLSDEESVKIIDDRYYNKLKSFVKQDLWVLSLNPTVIKISKWILEILVKISPKYEQNLSNLDQYLDLFDINLDTNRNFSNQVDTKWLKSNLRWNLKKWLNSIN